MEERWRGRNLVLLLISLAITLCCLVGTTKAQPGGKLVDDIAIQNINLLLPLTQGKSRVSYPLKAFNGCFQWTSTNPDVVSVTPLYRSHVCDPASAVPPSSKNPFDSDPASGAEGSCSTEAEVTVSLSGFAQRGSSFVIAEDTISGRRVRCEVSVDRIERIEIGTTSRQIYQDDVEQLEVLAFDQNGNLFSSLEGLHFRWSVKAFNPSVPTIPLSFVPYAESHIEVSDRVVAMERQGKEAHVILVKGVENGKAYVTAHMEEAGYGQVTPSSVLLSVLEPLELDPLQPVWITPGSVLQYHLKTFKNEYSRTIPMPNPRYVWSTTNSSVASVDSRGLARAMEVGTTHIVVQYEDMQENRAVGHLSVVWPAHLALKIVPMNANGTIDHPAVGATTNWYLINGHRYQIQVELYDHQNHPIQQGPDVQFEVGFSTDAFSILEQTRTGAKHTVMTQREGLTEITARLTHLIDATTRQRRPLPVPLVVRQEVVISSPVRIMPPTVRLPYDPQARHTLSLFAQGGSREFNWYSSDHRVVTVNSRGVVLSGGEGEAQIMAADTRNPTNRGLSHVSVLPVAKVDILPWQREVPVGENLILAIGFYDAEGMPFDNCTALSFSWSLSHPDVFTPARTDLDWNSIPAEQKKLLEHACTFRTIRALQPGYSTVTIRYQSHVAELAVFAYESLRVEPYTALVALGSSYTFTTKGGPAPWFSDASAFRGALTPEDTQQVKVEALGAMGNSHSFRVTCLEHGEQTLTISTGNEPSSSNPFPRSAVAHVTFACYPATSLFLQPRHPQENSAPTGKCDPSFAWGSETLMKDPSQWPGAFSLRADQQVLFQAVLRDHQGRRFDNVSSLHIQWSSDHPLIASFDGPVAACQEECLLRVHSKSGDANVHAVVSGHHERFLPKILGLRGANSQQNRLERALKLHALANVELSSLDQSLFLHPENMGTVHLAGGSSIFSVSANDTSVARLYHTTSPANQVEVHPQHAGVIQLNVVDQCLPQSEAMAARIRVSTAARIGLNVASSIPVGASVELFLSVLDEHGQRFNESQYRWMELHSHQDNHLLRIEPLTNSPSRFRVTGVQAGTTSISFHSVQASGQVVSSDMHPITVFPPFTLTPEQIVLAPGTSYQAQAKGGLSMGSSVRFMSEKPSVATVTDDGVITVHKTGETLIRAVIEGFSESTGKLIEYGSASMTVIGRDLTHIQLKHATSTVVVGSEMNILALGPQGESPFSYGSHLLFEWNSSHDEVLRVAPRYGESGCSLEEEHMFSARLLALSPGQARVTVRTVKPRHGLLHREQELQSSALIHVIEPLQLETPAQLLLTPRTTYRIRTNLDRLATLTYAVLPSDCSSDYQVCRVSEQGEIETTARTGLCYVQVHEKESAQSVVVLVEVKTLSGVQLTPDATRGSVYLTLPLSETAHYHVSYVDDLSRLFDHVVAADEFHVTSNAHEVVSVRVHATSRHVEVQAVRPGSAILRVSKEAEGTLYSDYLEVRVGNTIFPGQPIIHVGGSVQFRPQYALQKNSEVWWESTDPSILSIDRLSGHASALKVGAADVIFHDQDQTTHTRVLVSQVDQVNIALPEAERVLTNYPRGTPVLLPLEFSANGKPLRLPNPLEGQVVENRIQFSCGVEPKEWATATSVSKDGHAYCSLMMADPKVVSSAHRTIPDRLTLRIIASDENASYRYETSAILPFYSEFLVEDDGRGSLSLTKSRLHSRIRVVHGLTDVSAYSSDPDALSVRHVNSYLDSTMFEVAITKPRESFEGYITFNSTTTGQEKSLRVTYNDRDDFEGLSGLPMSEYSRDVSSVVSSQHSSSFSVVRLVAVLLMTLVAVVLGYYYFQPPTSPTSPGVKSPVKSSGEENSGRQTFSSAPRTSFGFEPSPPSSRSRPSVFNSTPLGGSTGPSYFSPRSDGR